MGLIMVKISEAFSHHDLEYWSTDALQWWLAVGRRGVGYFVHVNHRLRLRTSLSAAMESRLLLFNKAL